MGNIKENIKEHIKEIIKEHINVNELLCVDAMPHI